MTPDKFTNQEHFIKVGNNHQIYVHDWGNPSTLIPIIYLHGGPGNGCNNGDKKKFDPAKERVIFLDQRGSGRSTPYGELQHNTTADLVEDIDKIVDRLKLAKIILVGGSWGSALAFCYGIAHPSRVQAMVLDGILTCTDREQVWLEKGGWKTFFPDIWQEYISSVPSEYANDPTAYYYSQIKSGNQEKTKRAVYEILKTELRLLSLDERYHLSEYDEFDPSPGLIEVNYAMHNFYLTDNYITINASKLTMPIYMVQGRYDMVCTPSAAYELSNLLPASQLIWTISGHFKQHESLTAQRLLLNRLSGVN